MNDLFESSGVRPAVALIAGPTASGKSALAMALARRLGKAIVINADASQVYADLELLSARPTVSEMDGVPHRLFGHVDGAAPYSAAAWAAEARAAISNAYAEGAVPVLVGGTGLYFDTLLRGIAPVPDIDPAVRAAVRALPVAEAFRALAAEDPQAAARLNARDTTRVARALEVVRSTRTPIHVWQERREGGIGEAVRLTGTVLLPPRDWLMDRCDARAAAMIAGGAADEVRRLLNRRLSPDLPVMRAIGVPQIAAWLAGDIDAAEALARLQQATRQYAKRQYTWFRNQSPSDWMRCDTELSVAEHDHIVTKLHNCLLTG
jgi:tRNA dimethylallyltransferase